MMLYIQNYKILDLPWDLHLSLFMSNCMILVYFVSFSFYALCPSFLHFNSAMGCFWPHHTGCSKFFYWQPITWNWEICIMNMCRRETFFFFLNTLFIRSNEPVDGIGRLQCSRGQGNSATEKGQFSTEVESN